jgi:hypothetical protein
MEGNVNTHLAPAGSRRTVAGAAILSLLLACLASILTPEMATAKGEPGRSDAATASQGSIVGLWKRHTTCQQRVHALEQAGLGERAAASVVGQGFIPGVDDVSQLEDPQHPCKHAVAQLHYHFFTPDGFFGSLDQNLEVVDGDLYQVQVHRVRIGDNAVFDYRVQGDQILRLFPELPSCETQVCPDYAEWMVSVSYNGKPWHRVNLDRL